ncbi:MAG: glycosyltransferase family 2 protein [Rhodanobacter sp.]|jgi:GT2 family glycosyltransferase|nr:glycosyltransferase family 2 protein [Rhodanobacter sp.]
MKTHNAGLTSVIVVAADSGPLLYSAVCSALASTVRVEVILVDNASRDGEVERVCTAHAREARLRVLRNESNLGFGPACNRGAALASGDLLVFLNPDGELPVDALAQIRTVLTASSDIGLLGVDVRNAEGSSARGNRRRAPTLRRALMSMTGLARFESRWPTLAGVEMLCASNRGPSLPPPQGVVGGGYDSATTTLVEDVDAVSGACMILPCAVFEQLHGFDEGYFLHVEDLDLCQRVRDAGYRVALAHAVHVRHMQGSSSRRRPVFVARHKHRGMWRYFIKFDPAARNPLLRGLVWFGLWTHFVVSAPLLALKSVLRSRSS